MGVAIFDFLFQLFRRFRDFESSDNQLTSIQFRRKLEVFIEEETFCEDFFQEWATPEYESKQKTNSLIKTENYLT